MPINSPIPHELIAEWSARIAKDLKKWADTEYRDDITWEIGAGACGVQYVPPSQVTENISLMFTFNGKLKGKPGGKLTSNTLPDDINKYSVKNISKRIIKVKK